jgi:membrane protein implicated in regulation of membrane protease activity
MLFGSDWLANVYLGFFLFGFLFTSLSLVLNLGHFGGGVHDMSHDLGHAAHLPHDLGHAGHGPDFHAGDHAHADAGHGHSLSEQIDGLSPLNLPTVLSFLTWFGGAGYIFQSTLHLGPIVSTVLALISGTAGGALVFFILSYVIWRGQTTPMRRADFYLPGTRARVVSGITAEGTGEIVFWKGGSRRVEGARSATGQPFPRGTEVVISRYEKGLAYVQPAPVTADIPPPVAARVEPAAEVNTHPLNGNGNGSYTRDLRNQ